MSKMAIITCGSRGIGVAMAHKLGELGHNVVINYRRDSSKKLTDDLTVKLEREYGVKTLVVQADVSKYGGCEYLVAEAVSTFGANIDVLVNNAGVTNNSNWIDVKHEFYENLIAINLMSALHMTHLVLPHMVNHFDRDHQCSIVSTSSVGGLTGSSTRRTTAPPRRASSDSRVPWRSSTPAVACASTPSLLA